MSKIVFLDIDGVMNVHSEVDLTKPYDLTLSAPCEPHISALNEIVTKTGADVVISSTWKEEFSTIGWNLYFKTIGINARVVGVTKGSGSIWRGTDIATFVIEWNDSKYCKDPIESFVVIDDDYDPSFIADRWLLVKTMEGLLPKHENDAVRILEKQFSKIQVLFE